MYTPGPHARARWIMKVLVGLDQLLNALLDGDPDETVSSRAGRREFISPRISRWLCRLLDWLDPGHCDRVIGK